MNQSFIRPRKNFGQNFLKNNVLALEIVNALRIQKSDIVVEIGAGLGILTKILSERPLKKLIALEIDNRLYEILKKCCNPNVQILKESILDYKFEHINYGEKVKVIGNIPYNLTSQIILKIIEERKYISNVVLMVQKEVADRLVANPNCKDYGILSVFLKYHADVNRLFDVNRNNFFPIPKVDSTVLTIHLSDHSNNVNDYNLFKKIVRTCFQTRRKMLRNSLLKVINKEQISKIDSTSLSLRPEELNLDDFVALTNEIVQLKEVYKVC
jgi:16S rRNA (adenine1518-N6/adenine1519-N6)-dimethyltransferase